jgi:hypothetical protein
MHIGRVLWPRPSMAGAENLTLLYAKRRVNSRSPVRDT